MSLHRPPSPLLALGLAAFALAALSIVDMYLPRPYDGVVLEAPTPDGLAVGAVISGSGAARAGIRAGDRIVGIGRTLIESKAHAASLLNEHEIGQTVAYLVRRPPAVDGGGLTELAVELGRRQIGDTSYLYACVLGFSFFFIGLFVLLHQPRLRAAQVFFLLCTLFLLFLVCRLRPASYSWVDGFVLHTGTAALLLLPAAFLHFFLIFPRPVWDGHLGETAARLAGRRTWALVLALLYLLPVAIYAVAGELGAGPEGTARLISGGPVANWWVLAVYVVMALAVLAANRSRLPDSTQRRGASLVLAGSLVGWLPFLVTTVAFPSFLDTEEWVFAGVVPLAAIPLTFAYAIFRFELLDVRVILRKSLLYTGTTALVTVLYALGIASFNAIFRGTELAEARYFPLLFALSIVLLFEPLRHRIQGPMDRFFFAERTRLQRVMIELGEGFAGGGDPAAVVAERVAELPSLLGLRFAALYLDRDGEAMERVLGPPSLPLRIAPVEIVEQHLRRRGGGVARLEDLDLVRLRSPAADRQLAELATAGVAVIGLLASSRQRLGLVLLGGKDPRVAFEGEELELLSGVFHQAAIALETSRLLEQRARQAELERELEIASTIQASLLPRGLELGPGWQVAAACRPARHVGGDFYAALPGPTAGSTAVVYGDVSGKSVSGALMMMAASEVLHALALSHPEPEELFRLANLRLYEIADRSFVALGYFAPTGHDGQLRYLLAGQPQPLKRTLAGGVEELPLPDHRLPLGALSDGGHRGLDVQLAPGELLLAYSDGVVEAQDPAGELFGQDRLEAVLRSTLADARAMVDAVLGALDDFSRGEPAYDDVTLLAIGRPRPAEETR
ncbi:MAG TPA: SpoIIE family protein phosphatase [Thermoanaerobaculia bacterium]|nr:SpoIIE family protein phosphatase [Thermoanaerobaculia bacterium]